MPLDPTAPRTTIDLVVAADRITVVADGEGASDAATTVVLAWLARQVPARASCREPINMIVTTNLPEDLPGSRGPDGHCPACGDVTCEFSLLADSFSRWACGCGATGRVEPSQPAPPWASDLQALRDELSRMMGRISRFGGGVR